jgi:UDP-2,4-diacetamido-2,4,6-trideoxy-beta-L-altropyranose hydrolase
MKIVIFTEGGSQKGFGHIIRCLSLANEFRNYKAQITFIICLDKKTPELIKKTSNIDIICFDWNKNKHRLSKLIYDTDLIIIDSYFTPLSFYKFMSVHSKLLLCIDDHNRINYPRSVVLNGNLYAEDFEYPKNGNEYLLGPKFTPLRKGFTRIQKKKINKKIATVLITFGGGDTKNITPEIIQLLCKTHPKWNKKVIVGKGFKHLNEIESIADSKTKIIVYPEESQMIKLMLDADIAIASGGQTLYELLRIGVPTLTMAVANNQILNVKKLSEEKYVINVGNKNKITSSIKKLENKEVRKKMSSRGRRLVDGQGSKRVVTYCIKQLAKKNATFRKAELHDMNIIYKISNEPGIRNASFNTNHIQFKEHKIWYKNKIADKKCLFFVAELCKNLIGQLRFDIQEKMAILSMSITHQYNGIGIGTWFLAFGINEVKSSFPQISEIIAHIKDSNSASKLFFEKSHFIYRKNLLIQNQKAVEYCKKI